MNSKADLLAFLDRIGVAQTTLDHPAVFRVGEGSEIKARLPGAHTKNLFLKGEDGSLCLVVAMASTRVDLKGLAKMLRAGRFSFGKPELLLEVLGVPPGSVTAFAVINDVDRRVRLIVDQELMEHETINCHPLENTATTNIARDDLLRFIRACGHEPIVAVLAASTPVAP